MQSLFLIDPLKKTFVPSLRLVYSLCKGKKKTFLFPLYLFIHQLSGLSLNVFL